MYEKSDKRRLYWLMECYLDGKIDESTFCDEYYYSHDLEIGRNSNSFSIEEKILFYELELVADRYSPYEEEHNKCPKAFTTKQQLHDKIRDTYETLRDYDIR